MTIETVQIESISLDPANVRKHPTKNLDAIKGSLARFGQQRPIIVDAHNIIIAGNGTYTAARELGWQEIQVVRTALTGTEAVAFSIADNRAAETSEWDNKGLAGLLSSLQTEDAGLAQSTGFSLSEIASLIGANNTESEPEQPPAEFPAVDENIPTAFCCPECGYRWSGKADASA